ncbi:MAG TPA: aspartate/glutamate racemase family protein [Casimicrobiaceae bacterium]|nr:aspartate/glutamate racemase family protein [Casimicrobiaceae bacterium]
MRILLINPNTSPEMTGRAAEAARRYAAADTEIIAATGEFGCAVIASRASYAIAAHTALDLYAKHGAGADGVILACFGDPGLAALREVSSVPVIGLAGAAVAEAAEAARPFAIVTAGAAWVPMLGELVAATPHVPLFRGVVALDATGLSLVRNPDRFASELGHALDRAVAAGAQTIILGGAAFAGTAHTLTAGARLIDPMQSAIRAVERAVGENPVRNGLAAAASCAARGLSSELTSLLAGVVPPAGGTAS